MRRLLTTCQFAATFVAIVFSLSVHALPTFQVNSTADQIDDDVTDGICHTAANTCTLRAAVMQANAFTVQGSVINVPAGTFTLARPVLGGDGDGEGDLNFTGTSGTGATTTIRGAAVSATIIDAIRSTASFMSKQG